MNYPDFRAAFFDYKVFSTGDIKKLFPDFDTKRLVEWQRKGYVRKLINKWYLFAEITMDEMLLYRISNCIYRPSYISLESAFSHYNRIPEATFSLEAVTTRKTITYGTAVGAFHYRSIKRELFFGYQVSRVDRLLVLIAEIEKALLDYLYLNADIRSIKDLEALRFNHVRLQSIDMRKLDTYARLFNSKTLNKKVKDLKKLPDAYAS